MKVNITKVIGKSTLMFQVEGEKEAKFKKRNKPQINLDKNKIIT